MYFFSIISLLRINSKCLIESAEISIELDDFIIKFIRLDVPLSIICNLQSIHLFRGNESLFIFKFFMDFELIRASLVSMFNFPQFFNSMLLSGRCFLREVFNYGCVVKNFQVFQSLLIQVTIQILLANEILNLIFIRLIF